MARLKDDKSVMCLISAGRAFHSRVPATDKALSPNVSLVRGMSPLIAPLSLTKYRSTIHPQHHFTIIT